MTISNATSNRILSPRRARLLAALSLVGAAAAGCSAAPSSGPEPTANEGQDLYGLGSLATPWPGGQVPVCFQDLNDHPELQALIPSILFNSWTRAANITFTGFGACAGSGNKVTIVFSTTAGFRGNTNGLGYGTPTVTLISDDTAPNQPHFTYEVIHEMGHAIGFAHEMQRPDNWVGAGWKQCGVPPSNSDYGNYQAQPGGLNLTPNYDPSSIMNYCDPLGINTTQLSVGDILAASSPNAYGPSGCNFNSQATQCSWKNQLHAEETYTVPAQCPTTTGWNLRWLTPNGWVSATSSCTNGSPAGSCGSAVSATSFALGWQAEGAVGAGAAIGSTQTVMMCDAFNNCTAPFGLTITDCQTKADQLYLSPGNDPLQVEQEGSGVANLVMYGPWVQSDGGVNAYASVVNNPIPGATISFMRGSTMNGEGLIEIYVTTSLSTPTGTYYVTVQATDLASGVTRQSNIAVQVLACTPSSAADACTSIGYASCGARSLGCGQTVDCGSCASGSWCSVGTCCPTGTTYQTNFGGCIPNSCPTGTSFCADSGSCMTVTACNKLNHCKGTSCF